VDLTENPDAPESPKHVLTDTGKGMSEKGRLSKKTGDSRPSRAALDFIVCDMAHLPKRLQLFIDRKLRARPCENVKF
jgi:23S rRNA C2498 (ribose-2'-O)-methylase RlmM